MRLSQRIYRLLLKAYPKCYRQQFEEQMALLFADQLRAAAASKKLARLWLRTLGDFLRTLPARYLEAPGPRSQYGFEIWTESARRSILFARYEASSFGKREITAEHMLLGILRVDPPTRELAALRQEFAQEIEAAEGTTRRKPPILAENLLVSFPLREILSIAHEEARRERGQNVTPRHLLTAVAQKGGTLAADLLHRRGFDPERLRRGD